MSTKHNISISSSVLKNPMAFSFFRIAVDSDPESSDFIKSLDIITSQQFLSLYGEMCLVDFIKDLIERRNSRNELLIGIFRKIMGRPVVYLILIELKGIPDNVLQLLPENDKNYYIALQKEVFSNLINDCVQKECKLDTPFVSISDVLNELPPEDIGDPAKVQPYINFFKSSDRVIADFVINLVSVDSSLNKEVLAKNSIPSLLRPFKSVKLSIEQLILAFDVRVPFVTTQSSLQSFLLALKEVTGLRSIPLSTFLGNWEHKKTQLNILAQIAYSNLSNITVPKLPQMRFSPSLIGDFKGDIWRLPEFLILLSNLYNSNQVDVVSILKTISPQLSTALLLFVLANQNEISRFAAFLLQNLFKSESQYITCISSLWSLNREYLVKVTEICYKEKPQLIGRCYDIADDLGAIEEFISLSSTQFSILLRVFCFFRHGDDFQCLFDLAKFDDFLFQLFESPTDFGIFVPMNFERKLQDSGKDESADRLFFSHINNIFDNLDSNRRKKVEELYCKCCDRTPSLSECQFKWSQKSIASIAHQPLPSFEITHAQEIVFSEAFEQYVNGIMNDNYSDKQIVEKNGETIGLLLSKNLLSPSFANEFLEKIEHFINYPEDSNFYAFASKALSALEPGLPYFKDFARKIINSTSIKLKFPRIFEQSILACTPIASFSQEFKEFSTYEIKIHPLFDSMLRLKPSLNTPPHEYWPKSNNFDKYNFNYILTKSETILKSPEAPIFNSESFITNAFNMMMFMIKRPSSCSPIILSRLGQFFQNYYIKKKKPIPNKYLKFTDLIFNAYQSTKLYLVVPFVSHVFWSVPPLFLPPCPWTVSILSILGAIARIPYLRGSIYTVILDIFSRFNCEISDIEPSKIPLLTSIPFNNSDFVIPPINFSLIVPPINRMYSKDPIHVLINILYPQLSSALSYEIFDFISSKSILIADSCSKTVQALVLKDFSLSIDYIGLEVYALNIISPVCRPLSVLLSKSKFNRAETKELIPFIDSLLTQNSITISKKLLNVSMKKHIESRKKSSSSFWDIEYLPRHIAKILPESLHPYKQSLVSKTSTIYGCYSVPSFLKKCYSRLSALTYSCKAKPLVSYDQTLEKIIIDSYSLDNKSLDGSRGFGFVSVYKWSVLFQTIIHCFPIGIELEFAAYGASLLRHIIDVFKPSGNELSIYSILHDQIPHMLVFIELIEKNIVKYEHIEPLIIHHIDNNTIKPKDLQHLIGYLSHLNQKDNKTSYKYHRILSIYFPNQGQTIGNSMKMFNDYLYIYLPINFIPPNPAQKSNPYYVNTFGGLLQYYSTDSPSNKNIGKKPQFIQMYNDELWKYILSYYYPYKQDLIIKTLFSMLNNPPEDNPPDKILQSFVKIVFGYFNNGRITSSFISVIMSTIVMHLRFKNNDFCKIFGGLLKDTYPFEYPDFTFIWLYLFPHVLGSLLVDQSLYEPSSKLFNSAFGILSVYPNDWHCRQPLRKIYKSLLRLTMLFIHDFPAFMYQYSYEFLIKIPLRFRVLRNIILCCPPRDVTIPNNPSIEFDKIFDQLLQGRITFPMLRENLCEYEYQNIMRLLLKLNFHEPKIRIYAKGLILSSLTPKDMIHTIEALFDLVRNDFPVSNDIAQCIVNIFRTLDFQIGDMSVQNAIATVHQARIKPGPAPTPIKKMNIEPHK